MLIFNSQSQAFQEFQSQLKRANIPNKESIDILACIRVLQAKDFKVDASIELITRQMVCVFAVRPLTLTRMIFPFSNFQELRKKWKLDEILENPPRDILEIYGMLVPHAFHKFDKFGRPIYIQLVGSIHLDIFSTFVTKDTVRFFSVAPLHPVSIAECCICLYNFRRIPKLRHHFNQGVWTLIQYGQLLLLY